MALRLTIGWHFLYEGVWKIDNSNQFSALPFLTQAKGPFAPLFYAMSPDLNGVERLKLQEKDLTWWIPTNIKVDVVTPKKDEEGKKPELVHSRDLQEKSEKCLVFPAFFNPTEDIYRFVEKKYDLTDAQQEELKLAWGRYVIDTTTLQKNSAEDVSAYLESLKRLTDTKNGPNNGPEQKKRLWQEMMKLRVEAGKYVSQLDGFSRTFLNSVKDILTPEQLQKAKLPEFLVTTDRLPLGLSLPFVGKSWTKFLDFSVTWALTLIGVCLILGFCTRLAAIGGGGFLIMVLMTQPPWPTIYPSVHPEVGHAMIVDKNFVEMVAIFMLATLPVGRWGGLDFFIWTCVGKPLLQTFKLIPEEEA